jgi:hypothetical protein
MEPNLQAKKFLTYRLLIYIIIASDYFYYQINIL